MIFFPGCLLAAAWSCANQWSVNSLSLNIFILLSASSHALWASDWRVHIEGYRRPYQFCSDISSSMARRCFLAQRKMFTLIKKRKLKKQNNVKLLLVFLWSPFCLHYTEHRVEKGLVCDSGVNKLHRCESDVTVWQRAVRKKKNTWQHWKRELIGLEAFWLIQPFGNCSWLRSLVRMFAAVLQWSSMILLCVLLKFKWILFVITPSVYAIH